MWFGVSILMRGESRHRPSSDWLWEETIVLVEAESEEAAAAMAAARGRAAECSFATGSGETVHWIFNRVAQTCPIDGEPVSGTEVFSRHLRAAEVASLLSPLD
ncbi:MAG TPA: DUF4288 domain-containing protein [Pirellulales bacterium]|nr:DUF4288 domain-containing protein [Pirellulales bacterium]